MHHLGSGSSQYDFALARLERWFEHVLNFVSKCRETSMACLIGPYRANM